MSRTPATGRIASTTKTARLKPAKTTTTHASGRVATSPASRRPADDPLAPARVNYLLDLFTSKRLAAWVGVNASQTSRWATGDERPSAAAATTLIDLEHVYARARLVWGEEAAAVWLDSPNTHLGGARPLDVLRIDGPGRVLECLDAEAWGGAA